MSLCQWMPIILSHHPAIIGVYWSGASGDITNLICLVKSQGLLIKGCRYIMNGNTLMVNQHSAKFGGHRNRGGGDTFSICHVILQCQVTQETCDFDPYGKSQCCQV